MQEPINGFEGDLQATPLVLDKQDGPVVLVGHSYGGVVITTAGNDPKVEALVYVAAFQPAAGEITGTLNGATPPLLDTAGVIMSEHGFVSISEEGFLKDIAPDLPPEEARFLFASQTPTTSGVFVAEKKDPAWLHKPSFAVAAAKDRPSIRMCSEPCMNAPGAASPRLRLATSSMSASPRPFRRQ